MKNNEGKFYIVATAEAFGTTGQLCLDGASTSDLDFPGADDEYDSFEEAEAAAQAVDLQDFVDRVLDEMNWEDTDSPAGGCVRIEVVEGDGGLVNYEYKLEGGVKEIKSINVGVKAAQAELDRVSSTAEDLAAECPECGLLDAYVSTGEHAASGAEFVRCGGCGNWFFIHR